MDSVLTVLSRFTKIFTGEVSISGMHFILSIVLLRHLSLVDYGIFSLLFLCGGIIYAYISDFTTTPLCVYSPRTHSKRAQKRFEVIFGSVGALLVVTIFIVSFSIIWLLQKDFTLALIIALFLAFWGIRALTRGLFYARGLTKSAMVGDFVYSITGLNILCLLLLFPYKIDLKLAFLLVLIAQIASFIVSMGLKAEKIRITFNSHVRQNYKKLALKPAFWDSLSTSINFVQSHTQSFVVAGILGTTAYAPLAAGLVLFGPFRTVALALGNTLRPEFARALSQNNIQSIKSNLIIGSCGMTAMTLGYMLFLWIFWDYIYSFLFAAKFSNVSIGLIVFLNGVAALLYTNSNLLMFYLQSVQANSKIAFSKLLGACTALIVIMPLILSFPIAYSVLALILAEAMCMGYVCVIVYRDINLRVINMPSNIVTTK